MRKFEVRFFFMVDYFQFAGDSGTPHRGVRNDGMSGLGEHPWQGKIAQTKG